jgi:hypothetical protein
VKLISIGIPIKIPTKLISVETLEAIFEILWMGGRQGRGGGWNGEASKGEGRTGRPKRDHTGLVGRLTLFLNASGPKKPLLNKNKSWMPYAKYF